MQGIFIWKDYVCAMSTCVHLHTPALESGVIFQTRKDYCVALAHMAMAAAESGMEILAYALMSNHFHFILKGTCEQLFFQTFIRRFALYLARHGNPGVLNGMEARATSITSREQFRTEVAYVVRNPFVVREDIHPFVNIQTSAFLYFNPLLPYLQNRSVKGMSIRQKQTITMSKDIGLPDTLTMIDDMPHPASFVNYKLVESLFESPRQYAYYVMKNVEAQVEVARRLGEKPVFPDEDLLPICLKLLKEAFGTCKYAEMTEAQRLSVASRLKYDYNASNKQLARLLRVPLSTVDAMFPLSSQVRQQKRG